MSLTANRVKELWQDFMPLRNHISNSKNSDLFSVEVYDSPDYFRNFDPSGEYEKWAAIEVNAPGDPIDGMKFLVIPKGLYARFHYQGKPSEAHKTYQYIYETWIPASDYEIDHRPHFAVMGSKYKGEHTDSEEEIWIPLKKSN